MIPIIDIEKNRKKICAFILIRNESKQLYKIQIERNIRGGFIIPIISK
jgi:hypothetical protein